VRSLTIAGEIVSFLALFVFAVFGGLVVWHARVDARVAWFDALRLVTLRAMSRRARDWHSVRGRGEGTGRSTEYELHRCPGPRELNLRVQRVE
jgi:hypothetical protein